MKETILEILEQTGSLTTNQIITNLLVATVIAVCIYRHCPKIKVTIFKLMG